MTLKILPNAFSKQSIKKNLANVAFKESLSNQPVFFCGCSIYAPITHQIRLPERSTLYCIAAAASWHHGLVSHAWCRESQINPKAKLAIYHAIEKGFQLTCTNNTNCKLMFLKWNCHPPSVHNFSPASRCPVLWRATRVLKPNEGLHNSRPYAYSNQPCQLASCLMFNLRCFLLFLTCFVRTNVTQFALFHFKKICLKDIQRCCFIELFLLSPRPSNP